jgi:hypothetical protein
MQQWLHERVSLLRWYLRRISCFTVTGGDVLVEATYHLILFNSRQLYHMCLSLMLMIRNTAFFSHTLKLLNIWSWHNEALHIKMRCSETVFISPWVNSLFLRQKLISLHFRFTIHLCLANSVSIRALFEAYEFEIFYEVANSFFSFQAREFLRHS